MPFACSAMLPHSRGVSRSMSAVGLPGRHHRHAGDPARNRFVEFLVHLEVTAGGEGAEGGDPCEDLVGAASSDFADLAGIERVGTPDLAATEDVHELRVPVGVEELARA